MPIIPDEARTFGIDALFRQSKIYAPSGQRYEPVDADLLLSYQEATDGQILEEGITEAGSMASLIAAATAYATWGEPMIPFFVFYSMFGFHRLGDLIWALGDMRGRGFLHGSDRRSHDAAGRRTPTLRRLQPRLGRRRPELPRLRPGLRLRAGGDHPRRTAPHVRRRPGGRLLLHHPLQRDLPDAGDARRCRGRHHPRPVPVSARPRASGPTESQILASGTAMLAALEAQRLLADDHDVAADVWSATSYKQLRDDALSVERWNRLHPTDAPRRPYVAEALGDVDGPIVAVTDFVKAVPDQIARWVPQPFIPLGTDGFGLSDTRSALRRHFEVDAAPHRGGLPWTGWPSRANWRMTWWPPPSTTTTSTPTHPTREMPERAQVSEAA